MKGWRIGEHREVTGKKPVYVEGGVQIRKRAVCGMSPFWFEYEERIDLHTCKYRKIFRKTHIKLVGYH